MQQQTWLRQWSISQWEKWMEECRAGRRHATGPLKRPTARQRGYLNHARIPPKVVLFITRYEASSLIERLEREKTEFAAWRARKIDEGDWRSF